jgi:predicted membrane channel-forming protein YqfA (hemolysin III family)
LTVFSCNSSDNCYFIFQQSDHGRRIKSKRKKKHKRRNHIDKVEISTVHDEGMSVQPSVIYLFILYENAVFSLATLSGISVNVYDWSVIQMINMSFACHIVPGTT